MALSEKQMKSAKNFVLAKMGEGFTVQAFCSDNEISTKTWYGWLEDVEFKKHLSKVQNELIPDDEKQAYEAMKKHIMKIAYKVSPSPAEINLFMGTFNYLAEADKQKQMLDRGLAKGSNTEMKTVEERKAALLARLRPTEKSNNKGGI